MNKYITIILICISLTIPACKQSPQAGEASGKLEGLTRIEGTFTGGQGLPVVLEEMAVREYIPIDTVNCDAEGRFQIFFKQEHAAFYVLRTKSPGYITLLLEPEQKLRISGSYDHRDQYKVEGSNGSEQLLELDAEHKRTLNELSRITRLSREYWDLPDYPERKRKLDLEFDSITASFKSYSTDFIEQNQNSLSILIALYNLYGQGLPVFDPAEDFQSYHFVDSVLQAAYPDFEAVQLLHAQLLEAKTVKQKKDQAYRPVLGKIAPDFVSSQADGSQIALSDFRGNYVLLSFWAGWSIPSRDENQYLNNAWELYKQLNFRILQVSFDNERRSWTEAIEEDGLSWDHVSDLRRWESPVADLFQVEKIPSNYLIDPEGRIIAQDLFGRELINKLDNLYSND